MFSFLFFQCHGIMANSSLKCVAESWNITGRIVWDQQEEWDGVRRRKGKKKTEENRGWRVLGIHKVLEISCFLLSSQQWDERTPRETEKGEVTGFCHSETSSLGRWQVLKRTDWGFKRFLRTPLDWKRLTTCTHAGKCFSKVIRAAYFQSHSAYGQW